MNDNYYHIKKELIEYFKKNNTFIPLLDLASKNWSAEKADMILLNAFNDEKMDILSKKLNEQRSVLIKNIIKYDNRLINLVF